MKLIVKKADAQALASIREMLRKEPIINQDMIGSVENEPEHIQAVYEQEKLIGAAALSPDEEESFVYVFVEPASRRRGVGTAMLRDVEKKLQAGRTRELITSFPRGDEAANKLACQNGYRITFESAYMIYKGERFPHKKSPVRPYRDEDYPEAQALLAQAFHRMRAAVGDFPDSEPEQPSEQQRKEWAENAANQYIYLANGEIAAYARVEGNEIDCIAVRPDRQGNGIGKKLMKFLCHELNDRGMAEIVLWCVAGNPARRLYDQMGFQEVYTAQYAGKKMR